MLDHMNSRLSRRAVLQTAAVGAIGITPALRAAVYAAGSDARKKPKSRSASFP
jgi:nitrate/nitrite transport system substrate-binding protein